MALNRDEVTRQRVAGPICKSGTSSAFQEEKVKMNGIGRMTEVGAAIPGVPRRKPRKTPFWYPETVLEISRQNIYGARRRALTELFLMNIFVPA